MPVRVYFVDNAHNLAQSVYLFSVHGEGNTKVSERENLFSRTFSLIYIRHTRRVLITIRLFQTEPHTTSKYLSTRLF